MSHRRIRAGRHVDVAWQDIEHETEGWQSYAEIVAKRPDRFRSLGVVLHATKRWLIVAPTVNASASSAFCAYRIPRGAITRIRVIR